MWYTAIAALFCTFAFASAVKTPNVVVFLADDLGFGDLPAYGHPTQVSPNIDKLRANGIKLTQFYSGAPICSPSRGALVTGRIPARSGIVTGHPWPEDNLFRVFYPYSTGGLPDTEVTIGDALRPANYSSGIIGKWHLGHNGALPNDRGFDYFYGLPYSQDEGCPPYPCKWWSHIWPGVPVYRNDQIVEQPVNLSTLTEAYTQEGVEFIDRAVSDEKPFFLLMAYDQVHVPLFANPAFFNKSPRGLIGDAIIEMDTSIGAIMDHLKAKGLEEDTLVIFTSDNGAWTDQKQFGGNNGMLRGQKGETWEGGIREPMIAAWPGVIKPGTISHEVASMMDILPTVLKLADVPLPADRVIDGQDMLPVLKGVDDSGHEFLFHYRDRHLCAVRYKQYKAHLKTRSGWGMDPYINHDPPLLFDLENDPSEAYTLDAKDYKDVINTIKAAVAQHEAGMKFGPAELDPLSVNIIPCCVKQHGLIVNPAKCVCPGQSVDEEGELTREEFNEKAAAS